ncbi:hypothetical protein [Mesorhizobium sp. B1-1-5]|uniref:hypothetical protein n=1 Tax=Mesorhizobium sp. B1-1-5 TaxID=2589979 RepID=UPI0011260109|nr:hypothetical protein [Mesorhizobium sp. B1-1-5]TPO02186.1 hypothetical protein FJ980_18695 [Mesorhizobium sp. B1-1-5]
MKPIRVIPDRPLCTDAERVAWSRQKLGRLAADMSLVGDRLIAATIFFKGGDHDAPTALTKTEAVDASTDMIDACASGTELLRGLILEIEANRDELHLHGVEPAAFEVSFGGEVLISNVGAAGSILPDMTERE